MLAKLIATTALAILAAGAAIAANADRPHRARHARAVQQQTPPPPEAARLMAFRGVWNFDGTVTMGDNKPRKARWRMGCSQTAGGWALACDDTIRIPRMPVIREHDLFAYAGGVIHFYMANNTGEARELTGKWTSDTTIHYHFEGTQDGKPLVEDADVTLRDATTFDLTDTVTVGGKPFMAFQGTFHQQPKRARRGRNAPADAQAPEHAPITAPQQ